MMISSVLMLVGVAWLWLTGLNEVDYSLYPERSLQLQWLRAYLEAYKDYKDQGTEVSEAEVEVLYVQVNRFALVSVNECHRLTSRLVGVACLPHSSSQTV